MFPKREKLNLSGQWIVIADPERIGEEKNWYSSPPLNRGSVIEIPQTHLLDKEYLNHSYWYVCKFNLEDESWLNECVYLRCNYVNFRSSFWLNGKNLGEHLGAFTTFSFAVTNALRDGSNLLVIKVSPISELAQNYSTLYFDSSWFSCLGIWGEIYLERCPRWHIHHVTVRPDIRGKRVVIFVQTSSKEGSFDAELPELKKHVTTSKNKIVIPLDDFDVWSLDNPKLYDLHISYRTPTTEDTAQIRFGMRDFSEKDGRFFLNFHPIFVKAIEYDWKYSELNLIQFNQARLCEDISQLKKLGFNLIFTYGKPVPERVLEVCDELGILVAESSSLRFYKEDPWWNRTFDMELEELLVNHRNHPSLAWLLFEDASKEPHLANFAKKIRRYDRSRLIHLIIRKEPLPSEVYHCVPYNVDLIPSSMLALYTQVPVNNQFEELLETVGEPKLNFVLDCSHINNITHKCNGNLGLKNEEQSVKTLERLFNQKDLSLSFNSLDNLLQQMRGLYLANLRNYLLCLRKNPSISGYCLYTFGNQSPFNFKNITFSTEIFESSIKKLTQIHTEPVLNLSIHKTNLVQEEETPITLSLIGDLTTLVKESPNPEDESSTPTINLNIQIISPTQQVLWRKRKKIKLKKNLEPRWESDISGSNNLGMHILSAQATINDSVIAEVHRNYYVTTKPDIKHLPVEFIDPLQTYKEVRLKWTSESNVVPKVHIFPPLSNTIFAYPESELFSMLAKVYEGAIGIIFSPPDDWNALCEILPDCPRITNVDLMKDTCFIPIHYVKPHPFFINLPTRCVMRQPYRNIIPRKAFEENSDEDISGCFIVDNFSIREPLCLTNILICRHGVGKLVFTHLRIFENLDTDPVAEHILLNMLNYLVNRSIPSESSPTIPQRIQDWVRYKRSTQLRKWLVLGELPHNTNDSEILESTLNYEKIFRGKYGPIRWKLYYTKKDNQHVLDFHEALDLAIHPINLEQDNGVAYAYGEFNSGGREKVTLRIETYNSLVIWINNQLVYNSGGNSHKIQHFQIPILLKPWRNTILVKCIKEKGKHCFTLGFLDGDNNPIELSWVNSY